MEYNTSRPLLLMREYSRHVQKMIDYLVTIEDETLRTRNAEAVIELMSFLNPQLKTVEDYKQKLWDDLYYMSDFKLKVNSIYPVPDKDTYKIKPKPIEYPKRNPKYNHLGKNLELVIEKALNEENPEKKSGFAHVIAHYMKLAYSTWHKELVHDDNIRQELNSITKGQLEFTNTPYVRHRTTGFLEEESYTPVKRNKFKQNRSNNNRSQPPQQAGQNSNSSRNGNSSREGRNTNGNSNGGGKKFGKKNFR